MSLRKIPLLFLSATFFDVALTPQTPPHPEDKIVVRNIRERWWTHAAVPSSLFLKTTSYLVTVAESIAILGSLYDMRRSSSDAISVVLNALGPSGASQLTGTFALGALLVIVGGIIRVSCYRALGPYFTHTLCLRKDHKLVTTGPYAVVRHPAYAGLFVCIIGSWIMYGSPGSWWRASGVSDVLWVRVVAGGWWLITATSVLTLFTRPSDEDRYLSQKFGEDWEDWAMRVKYKLVPYVF